jgi:hypothetical protein
MIAPARFARCERHKARVPDTNFEGAVKAYEPSHKGALSRHATALVALVVLPRKDLAVSRNRKHKISVAWLLRQAFLICISVIANYQ